MFIFDFDDTLFDAQKLKLARLEAAASLGVSENLFWQTYQAARNTPDGVFTYSDRRHAEVLAMQGFDEDTVYRALAKTTSPERLKALLVPGARTCLEQLKSHGQPMVLLSLGDPAFQELKVQGSGIHDLFDRVFMVEAKKEGVLRELFTQEKEQDAWFINDKIKETKELQQLFPGIRIVLRQSPAFPIDDYEQSGLPFFQTLADMYDYIVAHN